VAEEADVKQDFGGAVSGRLDCAGLQLRGDGEARRGEVREANAYRWTGRMRAVDGAVFFLISRGGFGGE
jgi:hypothetical protein